MAITFPVLRRVRVSGYGIFENEVSSGIDHEFVHGVHVIAGINGLGKTTLLNILYRALLGPTDMSKDDAGLASTQHKLANWRNRKYFSNRVRDGAKAAWAEVEVGFGPRRLVVRRSLRTLEVEALSLDCAPEEVATQERYEELVQELSGCASYFDFFAILRFIVFFLEDRAELIWDRRSQFDMFRLLFYDRGAAYDAAEAYDEAQRLDSQYRNERVPIRRAQRELQAFDEAERSGLASEIRATRRSLIAAQAASIEGIDAIEAARSLTEGLMLRREKARLDLEEARRAHEFEQQLYYQHVFPDVAETANLVFLNLATAGSCLVCGSHSETAARRLLDFASRHQCPICESTLAEQDNVVSSAEFSQRRLDRAGEKVEEIREQLHDLEGELARGEGEWRDLVDGAEERRREVERWRVALKGLFAQLGPELEEDDFLADEDDEIAHKRQYVDNGLQELKRIEDLRTAAELRYIRIKSSQERSLAQRLATTKTAFARIAGHLLAEQCLLRSASEERRIGEEGERIEFPVLEVMMSSGVFTGSPSAREDADSVSESQREFIDLAFRMALIEAASAAAGDAMLVIETPEASLDSLFVQEAGELFRGFAAKGGTDANVFIASTNLNNEGMIPALFGAMAAPASEAVADRDRDVLADGVPPAPSVALAPWLAPVDRPGHLLNLLELSAPNAALRQHRAFYEEKLRSAMFADLDPAEREAAFRPAVGEDGGQDGGVKGKSAPRARGEPRRRGRRPDVAPIRARGGRQDRDSAAVGWPPAQTGLPRERDGASVRPPHAGRIHPKVQAWSVLPGGAVGHRQAQRAGPRERVRAGAEARRPRMVVRRGLLADRRRPRRRRLRHPARRGGPQVGVPPRGCACLRDDAAGRAAERLAGGCDPP